MGMTLWYVQLTDAGEGFATYSGTVRTEYDLPGHAAKAFLKQSKVRLTPGADLALTVYKLEDPALFEGTSSYEATAVK